jgi:hypothetical protein
MHKLTSASTTILGVSLRSHAAFRWAIVRSAIVAAVFGSLLAATPTAACTSCLQRFADGIVAPALPNGFPGVGHLAISDPSGDSAIFECIDGQFRIHHGHEYTVMTNSPPFDEQLALNTYWKEIGGDVILPDTIRARDRFVRTSSHISAIPDDFPGPKDIASVLSVIRNASAPLVHLDTRRAERGQHDLANRPRPEGSRGILLLSDESDRVLDAARHARLHGRQPRQASAAQDGRDLQRRRITVAEPGRAVRASRGSPQVRFMS